MKKSLLFENHITTDGLFNLHKMKLLIIEDEPSVISLLQRALQPHGYETSVSMNGKTGLQMALQYKFDLILLDLMLPGMDGIEICRNIRVHDQQTPVLMLTALGTTENIVTGLHSGADDYLTKPFKMEELKARLHTLNRRMQSKTESKEVLSFEDIELNRLEKTVSINKNPLRFTATEFRLLEFLMLNQGRVLSRLEILEYVWDINFNMTTNVVDVYINYLRKKIKPFTDKKLIQTIIGMGYVLRAEQ